MRRLLAVLVVSLAGSFLAAGCGDEKKPAVRGNGGEGGEGGVGGFDPGGSGGDGGGQGDQLQIPSLGAPVDVALDKHGVLHAACRTDADCVMVLGYFHAQNRFWQMDLQRRYARGRLATLIPLMLDQDRFMRHYMSTTEGEPIEEAIWETLDDDTKAILEAYTQGVNAWLADLRANRNGARLSEEYKAPLVVGTPALIPDWEPLDSVAFARLMVYMLSDSQDEEMLLGSAFPRLPAVQAVDFFTLRPGMKSYTVPAAGGAFPLAAAPDLEAIRGLQQRLRPMSDLLSQARASVSRLSTFAPAGEPAGSNNWVVSPSRTADGRALLANDPHLSLSNPSVWYFAELDSKTNGTGTLHVAGGTFPGIPGVPIGRNENVSWGATVAYFDVTDVYQETLNAAGDAVYFHGDEVKLISREHTFQVAGGQPVKVKFEWVRHHGPVLAKDLATGTAVSVKWTGHEPTNELKAFLGLARASSVAGAKEALKDFKVGAQNFVMIDTEGQIGWYPHANVPNRPWASYNQADPGGSLPPWMPLPGDGTAEWAGYLADDELPQLFDPPKGYIVTANQDLTGSTEDGDPTNDGHPMLQSITAPGFRHSRIVDLIEGGGRGLTPAMMLDFQGDDYSLLASQIVPSLLDAADTAGELTPMATKLVDALRTWNYYCPTGLEGHEPGSAYMTDPGVAASSIGCMVFHFTLPRLLEVAYADKLAWISKGTSINLSVKNADANMLIRPFVIALNRPEERLSGNSLWNTLEGGVRTQSDVLREGLEKAGREIVSPLGSDPDGWRWGRMHTVTFKTELSSFAPQLDIGPFATPGGQFTVNVANPGFTGTSFSHGAGASLRIVSEASSTGITTWLQLPGGQDLHRDGAHYGDLVERWLENRSFILPFSREQVNDAATVKLVAKP